jgi:glycerol uptake facilitator-like aquaporin
MSVVCGLACGIAFAGNVSGGGLNPAVAFGLNFSRLLTTGHIEECRFLWIYILGPLTASYLSAYFYHNIYRKFFEIDGSNEEKKKLSEYQELE